MDRTRELLGKVQHQLECMTYSAQAAENSVAYAQHNWEEITGNDGLARYNDEDPSPMFESHINRAADWTEDFRFHLKDFDKELAKLIELRGKLAEEVGIPMMSHMGTKKFGRHSKEYTL